MLYVATGLGVLACGFFSVFNALQGFTALAAADAVALLVLVASHLAYRRHRRIEVGSWLPLLVIVALLLMSTEQRGIQSTALFAPIVLIAFYLLGARGEVAMVSVVAVASLGWFGVLGREVADWNGEPPMRIVCAILLTGAMGYAYESMRTTHVAELDRLSTTDPLTGAFNRRRGEALLEAQLAARQTAPSVVLFDIDHFKSINDNHGHHVGDAVLRELSKVLEASVRNDDGVVRWGGEEFLVLLPHTKRVDALRAAERIRRAIAQRPLGPGIEVTVSGGVASATTSDDVAAVVKRADRGLYRAKAAGRDRICVEEPGDTLRPGTFFTRVSARVPPHPT